MPQHQLGPFTTSLSAKLATRSRHVSVFLGAGASRACGLPDVAGLQDRILRQLQGDLRDAFSDQIAKRNLEQVISRLRRISALLDGSADTIDGLGSGDAKALDVAICREIIKALALPDTVPAPSLRLAAWALRADYHLPVEVFTVNYDLLIESALETLGVPYFDGFVGALKARFRVELVEASPSDETWLPSFMVRVWKLHGSVNWAWDNGPRSDVVRLGVPVTQESPAAIYPSDAKYDESRRVPFVVLQDRFRRALSHPESITIIAGFAFGDAHLNEMIFDAASRCPRSEFVAFCFDDIPEALAAHAVVTPNLQVVGATEAILGGQRQAWVSPAENILNVWDEGRCVLGDFEHLSAFLARSSPPHGELEARLSELLAKAAGSDA